MEAERDSREEPDLRVHRLDEPVGETVVKRRIDRVTVGRVLALQRNERWDATLTSPGDPPVEGLLARVALHHERVAQTLLQQASFIFVSGYAAVWVLFSLAATFAQWQLERVALLSPTMVSNSALLGGALLLGAGIYQLSPLKRACLSRCRAPVQFVSENWHRGVTGAFRMGLTLGAHCLGCCWILMGILFVGGVMNLLWIAAISAFVLFEKTIPSGKVTGWFVGAALITAAGFTLAST